MPRGRYQQKQWDTREKTILESFEKLSRESDFTRVTMDNLADQVGISKATLYQHFPSKEAMLQRLIALHIERFLAWLDTQASQPPITRLCQSLEYLLDAHIIPRSVGRLEAGEMLADLYDSEGIRRLHRAVIDRLAAIVTEGQRDGTIADDLSPSVVIQTMIALSLVRSPDTVAHPAEHVPAEGELTTQLVRIFARALRPHA